MKTGKIILTILIVCVIAEAYTFLIFLPLMPQNLFNSTNVNNAKASLTQKDINEIVLQNNIDVVENDVKEMLQNNKTTYCSWSISINDVEISSEFHNAQVVNLSAILALNCVEYNSLDKMLTYKGEQNFAMQINKTNSVQTEQETKLLWNNFLQSLGFTAEEKDDEILLERTYLSKRLIVNNNEKILNLYNAIEVINFECISILQYKNEYETSVAFANFTNENFEVCVDTAIKANNSNTNFAVSTANKQLNSFNSWGGEHMGFDKFTTYLKAKYNNELKEQIVAVLDSGVNASHELLRNRVHVGSRSVVINSSPDQWEDDFGHGTHVAGIIADLTTDNVQIIAIKVLNDDGSGEMSSILLGFRYIVALLNAGVNICAINFSIGAEANVVSNFLYNYVSKIQNIVDEDVAVCVSAGNNSQSISKQTPANMENVITVSSISKKSSISQFSNYGDGVDFCAPGEEIISANFSNIESYEIRSGTSMAAPHVTAALAMLMCDINEKYTISSLVQKLKVCGCEDLGDRGYDEYYGYGCINLSNMIITEPTNKLTTYTITSKVMCEGINAKSVFGINFTYFDDHNQIATKTFIKTQANTNFQISTYYNYIFVEAIHDSSCSFVGWKIGGNETCKSLNYTSNSNAYKYSLNSNNVYIFSEFEQVYSNVTLMFNYITMAKDGGKAMFDVGVEINYYSSANVREQITATSSYKPETNVVNFSIIYNSAIVVYFVPTQNIEITNVYTNMYLSNLFLHSGQYNDIRKNKTYPTTNNTIYIFVDVVRYVDSQYLN